MVSPVGGDELGNIEHLPSVDFITVEVTTEETSIRVGLVETLLEGDIGKGTQELV